MPSSVNLSRFNRAFEKFFNVKGGPTVVDIEPNLALSYNLQLGVEERYLFAVESFGAASAQPGVAGNKSAVMLRNPLGSNTLVTVEKILVSAGTAGTATLGVAGSNPADLATSVPSNTRADPRNRSHGTAVCSQDAPAADPTTGFLNIVELFLPVTPVDLIISPTHEIVLLPQIAFRFVIATVNTALFWTIFWRERALETSELT